MSITLNMNYKYTACQTQSQKHWVGLDPNGKAAGRAGFLEWFIKQMVMKTDSQGVSPLHANKSVSLKTWRSTKKRQEQVTPGTRNKLTKTNTWAFIYIRRSRLTRARWNQSGWGKQPDWGTKTRNVRWDKTEKNPKINEEIKNRKSNLQQ